MADPNLPSHISTFIAVRDLDASRVFYQTVFGWPIRVEVPVLVEFALPDGRGLALYRRENFGNNTNQLPEEIRKGGIAGHELYFHCPELDTVIERLEKIGARCLSPLKARDWGDDAAYYVDPDGTVIAVARRSM
jgi:predicted enzyme related to lactoylglutathione lyase